MMRTSCGHLFVWRLLFVTMALQLVTILLENIPHFPFYYRSIRLGAALLSIISCMSCHFTFKETSAFSFLKIMPNWSATTSIWIANAAFTFELYAHYPYLGIQTDVGNWSIFQPVLKTHWIPVCRWEGKPDTIDNLFRLDRFLLEAILIRHNVC